MCVMSRILDSEGHGPVWGPGGDASTSGGARQVGRCALPSPQHHYQHFHGEALPGWWSGPALAPEGLLLALLCPAVCPGEKAHAMNAGGAPPCG